MKNGINNRITVDGNKMSGVPCIRGLRMPVETIAAMLMDGMSPEEILSDFPYLEKEDIEMVDSLIKASSID